MNQGIYTIVAVDDDFCTINGVSAPRAWNAFPADKGALVSGPGEPFVALLGSSVGGSRPSTVPDLVTALRTAMREPERNSLLDAIEELEDGTYTITVTDGLVTFDEAA